MVGTSLHPDSSCSHSGSRNDETLARLRNASVDDLLVRIEFLEMKSLHTFEKEVQAEKYPQWLDGSFSSRFKMGLADYASLVTNPSLFKRTTVAV